SKGEGPSQTGVAAGDKSAAPSKGKHVKAEVCDAHRSATVQSSEGAHDAAVVGSNGGQHNPRWFGIAPASYPLNFRAANDISASQRPQTQDYLRPHPAIIAAARALCPGHRGKPSTRRSCGAVGAGRGRDQPAVVVTRRC